MLYIKSRGWLSGAGSQGLTPSDWLSSNPGLLVYNYYLSQSICQTYTYSICYELFRMRGFFLATGKSIGGENRLYLAYAGLNSAEHIAPLLNICWP